MHAIARRSALLTTALLLPGTAQPTPAAGPALDARQATLTHVTTAPGDSPGALALTFAPARWPTARFAFQPPADWRPFGAQVLEVHNPGPRPVRLHVRIDDAPAADGTQHRRTASGTLAPGGTERLAVNLGPEPMSLGMRALPGPSGVRVWDLEGQATLDLGHVAAVLLFLDQPAQTETLVVRASRLDPRLPLDGLVDRYGQRADVDWPGKVHADADLLAASAAEAADLKGHPPLPDRDRFGGWSQGPTRRASGFFRAEAIDGVWWLVDPDGRLFFSSGVDCVQSAEPTILTGRESFFRELPPAGDPQARFFGQFDQVHRGPVQTGRTFDFHRANLFRAHGPDWESAWRERTLARLPSWGFNTIGNWSDWQFHRNGRIPYVATASINGPHARVSSGSDYWGKMHDPFDPRFARSVERSLRPLAERIAGDPWCVGVFVDNELSWGGFQAGDPSGRLGLALGALQASPDSPARLALLSQLREQYGAIERLNTAWATSFATWDELARSTTWRPQSPGPEAMQNDLRRFVATLARRYFETVAATWRRLDPNHLYLGCRFAWKTTEAIEAAAASCDVVSFNIYKQRVDPQEWAFLSTLGKPALIGEFHVGATDRGMLHTGLVAASSQAERAAIFRDYVASVIDHPALVGCHWFQYVDQPLTGRVHDGENYNIGFLTVTDTPYPEMVNTARSIHAELYPRRSRLRGEAAPSGL